MHAITRLECLQLPASRRPWSAPPQRDPEHAATFEAVQADAENPYECDFDRLRDRFQVRACTLGMIGVVWHVHFRRGIACAL